MRADFRRNRIEKSGEKNAEACAGGAGERNGKKNGRDRRRIEGDAARCTCAGASGEDRGTAKGNERERERQREKRERERVKEREEAREETREERREGRRRMNEERAERRRRGECGRRRGGECGGERRERERESLCMRPMRVCGDRKRTPVCERSGALRSSNPFRSCPSCLPSRLSRALAPLPVRSRLSRSLAPLPVQSRLNPFARASSVPASRFFPDRTGGTCCGRIGTGLDAGDGAADSVCCWQWCWRNGPEAAERGAVGGGRGRHSATCKASGGAGR